MITAGIDVGQERIKVVILENGKVLARGIAQSRGIYRAEAVERIWTETLSDAGLDATAVEKIVATGLGKFDVPFAHKKITEAVADARAARFLSPEAAAVADVGADQILVMALGEGESILEASPNQKCSAGIGTLLRLTARRLEMSLTQMSELPPDAAGGEIVNDNCRVFIEMDVLSLLCRGVASEKISGAVVNAAAVRVNSVLNDKVMPPKKGTILCGGLSVNGAFVRALSKISGIEFLIPEHSEYMAALGAAVIAARLA